MLADADGRGLLLDLHAHGEDAAHDADQLVDAVVVDAVFRRGKEAVLSAEAQDVPGIDQRPALDAAVQDGDRFLQQPGRLFQLRRRAVPSVAGLQVGRQTLGRRDACTTSASSCTSSMARWAVVSRQWMSHFIRAEATGTMRACRCAASV